MSGSFDLGADDAEWDAVGDDDSPERAEFRVRRLRAQKLARFFGAPAPLEGVAAPPMQPLGLAFPDPDLLDDKVGDLLPSTRPGTPWVNVKGRDSSDSYFYPDSDPGRPQIAVGERMVDEWNPDEMQDVMAKLRKLR